MWSLEISLRHVSIMIAEESISSNWPSPASVRSSSASPPGRKKALIRTVVSKTARLILDCASPVPQAFQHREHQRSTALLLRRFACSDGDLPLPNRVKGATLVAKLLVSGGFWIKSFRLLRFAARKCSNQSRENQAISLQISFF